MALHSSWPALLRHLLMSKCTISICIGLDSFSYQRIGFTTHKQLDCGLPLGHAPQFGMQYTTGLPLQVLHFTCKCCTFHLLTMDRCHLLLMRDISLMSPWDKEVSGWWLALFWHLGTWRSFLQVMQHGFLMHSRHVPECG